MKNKTQKQRVETKLLRDGFITRNECLRVYISRLGAIICDLTKEGWEFETKFVDGDYQYKMVKSPYKTVTRTLSNGEQIVTISK
jgi:hypothetical protein